MMHPELPFELPLERPQSRLMHHLVQTVIQESFDDDHVWWTLNGLEEENALPDGVTAHDCYQLFLRNYCGE